MLNVIIADDERLSRHILKKIVSKVPGVKVIGEVENGQELVQLVREKKPELVFLDVNMPEMNGAQAAKEIFEFDQDILIIFATGFDSYTHEAFAVYAFDYIMKPFAEERINQTLARAKEWKEKVERLRLIERAVPNIGNRNWKIKVQSEGHCFFINAQDIVFITRDERKTVIHTINRVIKTYEPMEKLYQRLDRNKFFRCHKGYIINTDMVTELEPWGHKTYMVRMENTRNTVLMTFDKAKEFHEKYCIE